MKKVLTVRQKILLTLQRKNSLPCDCKIILPRTIWMHFIYSSAHGLAFNDVIEWLVNERPKDDEKYLRELNFDISRKIYNEKSDFVKFFAERFRTEGSGQFWDFGTISAN